jgi:hypothetical protein
MATTTDLSLRILQKLKALGSNEPADADDLVKALEKLKAAHYAFRIRGLVRWTLNTIPDYAEEPYVLMAAFLGAAEFDAVPDQTWPLIATTDLQRAANLPAVDVTPSEDF